MMLSGSTTEATHSFLVGDDVGFADKDWTDIEWFQMVADIALADAQRRKVGGGSVR